MPTTTTTGTTTADLDLSGQSIAPNAQHHVSAKDSVRRRLNFDNGQSQSQSHQSRPVKVMSDANTQTNVSESTDNHGDEIEQCSICLCEKDRADRKNTTITECGHVFCTSCLLKNLTIRNICPNCRAEIEPARSPVIEQLTATIVSNAIQEEEVSIDITRRIAVIGAFPVGEGRNGMILSLVREVAFGAGHGLAAWQGTDETTYHSSWNEFEYTHEPEDGDDDDDDDESDDDGDDESDNEGGNVDEVRDNDMGSGSESEEEEEDEEQQQQQLRQVRLREGRGGFQSPLFVPSAQSTQTPRAPVAPPIPENMTMQSSLPMLYTYIKCNIVLQIAIFALNMYMKM